MLFMQKSAHSMQACNRLQRKTKKAFIPFIGVRFLLLQP
jgi:hypothetical protein